jgi:hypothetical protein
MRNWKYAGAENVLRLRAALQDGSYDEVWEQQFGISAAPSSFAIGRKALDYLCSVCEYCTFVNLQKTGVRQKTVAP